MAMSTKILGFFGTAVAAAAIWGIIIEPIVDSGVTVAKNTSLPEAQTGATYLQQTGDWSGLIVLLLLGLGLLAAAIYRSENPR